MNKLIQKILNPSDIENLNCFSDFQSFQKRILTKRNNLRVIQEALIYYRKYGQLPQKLGISNQLIVQELIEIEKQENHAATD